MLSRRFGPPVRQPRASTRNGETITPTKPKKQPLALSPKKSTPTKPKPKKQPRALPRKKSAGGAKQPCPAAKKGRKSPAVGGSDKLAQDVGSVHETDESHWKRHSGDPSSSSCCRCFYIRHKAEFRREFPWLGPRPMHMGSDWRLGCHVCHKKEQKETGKPVYRQGRRGCSIRASDMTRFNYLCEPCSLRDILEVHQRHCHKIAEGQRPKRYRYYTIKATETIQPLSDNVSQPVADNMAEKCIAAATDQVLEDGALLKGYVPQVQDWLSAWAESTEQISFRKQARLAGKRLRRTRGNLRKVRRKQLKITAECRRRHLRQILRKGIEESSERSAVGDFEEDHALVGIRKIDAFLNTFCTPLVKANEPVVVDIELKEHILKCTRAFAADGASSARRVLLLAAEEVFPNVVVLLRDAAHILRISVRDPLHLDRLYGEVWEELFNKRHALVPDVMNSKK